MRLTLKDRFFIGFEYVILGLFALMCVYPFVYVISASLSSGQAVTEGRVFLLPVDFNIDSYKAILSNPEVWRGLGNTVFYTLGGVLVSLFLMVCGAYPLSKKYLKGTAFIAFFVSVTLWFDAGMIPTYLNFVDLNLLNTRTVMLIGFALDAFHLFILRTSFMSLPDSLEESAKMDGANDWQILWKIYVPLSIPSIITVGLMKGVQKWNSFFWAMVLLQDEEKVPLQVLLQKLVVDMNIEQEFSLISSGTTSPQTLVYALIIFSTVPILLAYPYLQKHFKKGAVVGAVKE